MIIPKTVRFHAWRPAAWLRVSGADAADFLQGQFTNDLRQAAPGRGVYGLWLNQKGKVLGDSFVIPAQGDGEFLVASYFSKADVLRQRLEAYVVADDVAVEDATAGWAAVSLLGKGAGEWLASKPREGTFFAGRRSAEENWEWAFPSALIEAVRKELSGAGEIAAPELERLRISAGIPAVPADAGPGDLPNEALLGTDAISGTKGCYLGQEVMARLRSRGKLRRKLFRVAGAGSPPSLPAPLWQGGRAVGELRSFAPDGAGFVGLAMLTLGHLLQDIPLALGPEASPALAILPNQL
jgi:folate-binding protein YgfZ